MHVSLFSQTTDRTQKQHWIDCAFFMFNTKWKVILALSKLLSQWDVLDCRKVMDDQNDMEGFMDPKSSALILLFQIRFSNLE
jgi:hypothetical protein